MKSIARPSRAALLRLASGTNSTRVTAPAVQLRILPQESRAATNGYAGDAIRPGPLDRTKIMPCGQMVRRSLLAPVQSKPMYSGRGNGNWSMESFSQLAKLEPSRARCLRSMLCPAGRLKASLTQGLAWCLGIAAGTDSTGKVWNRIPPQHRQTAAVAMCGRRCRAGRTCNRR